MKRWLILLLLAGIAVAQQTNNDILPATTGLNLGRSNQRWNGFFNNVNITGTCTINNLPCISAGGGDVFKGLPNVFTSNNTFNGSVVLPNLISTCLTAGPTGTINGIKVPCASPIPTPGGLMAWALPTGNTLAKNTLSLTLTNCVVTGTNLATCLVDITGTNPSATTVMGGNSVTLSGFTSTGAFLNATYTSLTYIDATHFSVPVSGSNNTYSAGSPKASTTTGIILTPVWASGKAYLQLNWVTSAGNYYRAVGGANQTPGGGLTSLCAQGNQNLNCGVSGASAPTCTGFAGSTACSDGGITWTWMGSTASTSNAGQESLDDLSVYVWTSPLIAGVSRSILAANTGGSSNVGWADQSNSSATAPSVDYGQTINPDITTKVLGQPNFPLTDKVDIVFSHVLGSTGSSAGPINSATPWYVFTQAYANSIKNSWAASTKYLPWQYIWDGTHFQFIANADVCTSSTSAPSFNHAGSTTSDGSCTWQDNGTTNAPPQHALGGCTQWGNSTMNGLAAGIYSVNATNSTGGAAQVVTDLVTAFPVTWETPFLTFWKLSTQQAVANFNLASYTGRVAYMRVALGAGGENFAWCTSQMEVPAGGSSAGVPVGGTPTNFRNVWTSATNNIAFPFLAQLQASSSFPLMSSFNGGQNSAQPISVADTMAVGLAASQIGAGSQGLSSSDASSSYPASCGQDACTISSFLQGQVPFMQGQTAGVTDPTNVNAPGSMSVLLPFWGTWLDVIEPFTTPDIFLAFDPNWSSYGTYGTAQYAALQNFVSGAKRSRSVLKEPVYNFATVTPLPVANAVDGITVTPSATGSPATVSINASGSDATIKLNLTSKGGAGVTCDGVPCGGSGSVVAAQQYDFPYYSAAGISTAISGLAPTASLDGVPQVMTETTSGGVATIPVMGPSGVPTNAQTGTTYTINKTDRGTYVTFSNAGSIAVTLPQSGTTGFTSNFVFVGCDIGIGTATITPTTSTISYTNGSAYTSGASTLALTTGQCAWVYSDNTNYFAILRTALGSLAFSSVTAGTNTAGNSATASSGLVVGTTGTLSPVNTGQIAASQDWYQNGPGVLSPPVPSLAVNTTGGTLTNGSQNFFKITYVGLSVTEPSGEVKTIFSGLTGCTGGNQCSITVTMPVSCTAGNLPSGVTGCTVWDSTTTQTEKQQTASAACVNITTTTCVVGTLGAGSSLTTPQTGIIPAGAQTVTCPNNIIPTNWEQKSDGNFYNLGGIDVSAMNLPVPIGRFTFCDGVNFNDTSGPPSIQNALVSIHHVVGATSGTTLNGATFIAPALGVEVVDDPAANPLALEQQLVVYGERIISNNNITCAPIGGETCAGFLRGVVADNRTAGYPALSVVTEMAGVTGQAFVNIPSGGGNPYGSCSPCMVGIEGNVNTTTAANLGSNFFAGVQGKLNNAGAATTGNAYSFIATLVNRFTQNGALYVPSGFSNAADFSIRSDATAKSKFQGTLYLGASNAIQSNAGLMTITGSENHIGSISTAQLSTPAAPTLAVTLGAATTWAYKFVFKDGNGGTTVASSATSTGAGPATLDGTHFITITPTAASVVQGVVTIDVYRTTAGGTPNTTGKIGSINVAAGCADNISTSSNCGSLNLVDNGLAGDSATAPTINTTASVNAFSYQSNTNCAVNSVSPAACGSAAAGAVVVPTTTTTYTINTSAVTAHSRIFLMPMSFAGDLPSAPTCVAPAITSEPTVSAISAGVSFSFALASTTGQTCWQYWVVN